MVSSSITRAVRHCEHSKSSKGESTRPYAEHHDLCAASARRIYRSGPRRLLRPRLQLVLLVDTKNGAYDTDTRHEDEKGLSAFLVHDRGGSCFFRSIWKRKSGLTISGYTPNGSDRAHTRGGNGSRLRGCIRWRNRAVEIDKNDEIHNTG